MEITFCELRAKEVINIYDGRSLGNITDIVIDTSCARVLGIIVPKDRSLFSIFKSNTDFFIPYNRICKIGKDIILVELTSHQINSLSLENKKKNEQKDLYKSEEYENLNGYKSGRNKKQNNASHFSNNANYINSNEQNNNYNNENYYNNPQNSDNYYSNGNNQTYL